MKKLFIPLLIAGIFSNIVFGAFDASCSHCSKASSDQPSCHQTTPTPQKSCHTTQTEAPPSCHQDQSQESDYQISCQADELPVDLTVIDTFKKDIFEIKLPVVVQVLPEIINSPPIYYIHDPSISISSDFLSLLKPIRLLC